jgi:peptidyl-prolyl cis-trans isomerase SurA
MKKLSILTLALLSFASLVRGQKMVDGVVAVVGSEPIMYSEIEVQLKQVKDLKPDEEQKARCYILDQIMSKKLMLTRAKTDSLKVTDQQVEDELDRRIQYFVSQFGSEAKFEAYYNKTIPQFKAEFRDAVKEQLLTDQQQNKIIGDLDVTPEEIKKFYSSIPEDSLPYYNTEMEIGQIVVYPKVTKDEKQREYQMIKGIREDIINGDKFSTKAIAYSEDPGSAVKGGDLGWQRTTAYVPEFAAAALAVKRDSISPIIETKYGYHIIQMIERKGDLVHVRHILRIPKVGSEDRRLAKMKLDSIHTLITQDTMSFANAAYKFSEDEETRNRGGLMVDSKTNSARIPVDELDANVFFIVDKLKPGEVSDPVAFTDAAGKEGYRILYLKSKTPPHKANMDDDYPKIKDMALQDKKINVLQSWIVKQIPQTYARINYNLVPACPVLDKWKKARAVNLVSH